MKAISNAFKTKKALSYALDNGLFDDEFEEIAEQQAFYLLMNCDDYGAMGQAHELNHWMMEGCIDYYTNGSLETDDYEGFFARYVNPGFVCSGQPGGTEIIDIYETGEKTLCMYLCSLPGIAEVEMFTEKGDPAGSYYLGDYAHIEIWINLEKQVYDFSNLILN